MQDLSFTAISQCVNILLARKCPALELECRSCFQPWNRVIVLQQKTIWSSNSWLNRQAVTAWSEHTFISEITLRYLQVSWNNGWEKWGRQHSSEWGQGASPGSIPGCWRCFALHIPSFFSFHLPTAGWAPLLEVSLPQSQVSGRKVLGAAMAVFSLQPSSWPLWIRCGLPDLQTPGVRAVSQLLITGALFPLYWVFPGLPLCVSLPSFCNGNLSFWFTALASLLLGKPHVWDSHRVIWYQNLMGISASGLVKPFVPCPKNS